MFFWVAALAGSTLGAWNLEFVSILTMGDKFDNLQNHRAANLEIGYRLNRFRILIFICRLSRQNADQHASLLAL